MKQDSIQGTKVYVIQRADRSAAKNKQELKTCSVKELYCRTAL
jgi:hypothetical protein